MNSTSPKVYIIDDNKELSASLRWLFESVDFAVETFDTAQLFLDKNNPGIKGCLLVDVRLPVMSGFELLEQLKIQKYRLATIMITGHGDIPMAVRAMKAGAKDFLLKPFNEQLLLETVQKYMHQAPTTFLKEDLQDLLKKLSLREQQILDLLVAGKINKEIAYQLGISISTVETHRASMMKKMQVKAFAQLIKLYTLAQLNTEPEY